MFVIFHIMFNFFTSPLLLALNQIKKQVFILQQNLGSSKKIKQNKVFNKDVFSAKKIILLVV